MDKLHLSYYQPEKYRNQIAGIAINGREKICIEKTDAVCAIFFDRINLLWCAACQKVPMGDEFYPQDFDRSLAKVAYSLLPLFLKIMQVEVNCKYIPSNSKYDQWPNDLIYFRTAEFLLGIQIDKIQPLDCVDKYFGDIAKVPNYIQRMLMKMNAHYHLKDINANCLLYKLAILRTLNFETEEHQFTFNKKIEKWEEYNKDKIEKASS